MTWCDCTTYGACEPCDVFRRREYSRSGPTPPSSSAWSLDEGSGRDSSPPPHPLTTQLWLEEAPVTPELGNRVAAEGEAIDDLEEDCYA